MYSNWLQKYEPAAKSQLKKIQKIWVREGYKGTEKSKREEEDATKRAKNLEEAKEIHIKEDTSLPKAKLIKIIDGKENRGVRVKINGWVHRLRRQGIAFLYNLVFVGY
jgi:asparaginyl-tRNA synthetase